MIWLGPKNNNREQVVIDLTKESDEVIKDKIAFCENMLYSNDRIRPGRYIVKSQIENQIKFINAEIAGRKIKSTGVAVIDILKNFNNYTTGNPEDDNLIKDSIIDRLGQFKNTAITLALVVRDFGIKMEKDDYAKYNLTNSDDREALKLEIKNLFGIDAATVIRLKKTGLTINDVQDFLGIKNKKYSELSQNQLLLLKNKLLPMLYKTVQDHIDQWDGRIKGLNKLLDSRK